jgi:hypothetical protein
VVLGAMLVLLLGCVTLVEAVNSTINLIETVFASKEWVAATACVDTNFVEDRPRFKRVTTTNASNLHLPIVWMDTLFHNVCSLLP